MTTIMQPLQCDVQPQIHEMHRTTGTTAAATAAHTRYLSSPAATTLHRKMQDFVLRLFPPKQSPCNIHAAITMQCSIMQQTCIFLRTWQHQMTAIMQPLQCDLQQQIQETHRITHRGTTTRCRTQRRNPLRPERPQPQPPHTRGLQPLYTGKYKVSCSGFLQHSCSHYNAFCSIMSQTCIFLRTWQRQMTTIMQTLQCDLRPQIQETHRTMHTGTTTRCRTQRRNPLRAERPAAATAAHTRYRGTFQRPLQPLYTDKYKVSCSGFLPNTSVTTSLRHHVPSSPLPFVTIRSPCTALHHHPVS